MKVIFCPHCKSQKIEIVREGKFPGLPYFPYGAPNFYRCKQCGFTASSFPVKEKIKKTFRRDKKNNLLKDSA